MKSELLDLICCPSCRQALEVEVNERNEPEIWTGKLLCAHCQTEYTILHGMPHLYIEDESWTPKAAEAAGWVTLHRNMGNYDVTADAVDLKIPYYPEEPWIKIARSFDIALAELNLTGNETILDLGAGRGWAAKQFALRGCRVVALDIVADTNIGLGRARALMEDAETYFDRIIADGENLPFFSERFDLVFCAAALHHSSYLQLLMSNISRVLKPGGLLCAVNEPCRGVLSDESQMLALDAGKELELGIIETRPDLVAYDEALQQAGLSLVKAFPPQTWQMDEATLRAWAGLLGAIRPSWRQRPFINQLSGWGHYLVYRWWATKLKTKDRLNHFTPDEERQRLEIAILLWVGNELFLIANKPS